MSAIPQSCEGWQSGFLTVMPAVQTHVQIMFRHLPLVHREEAVQEAIASAVLAYRRLAAQGRLHVAHPGTLAANAVHHVRNGRHVGGHQDGARDALSPVCQRRRGFEVVTCDPHRPHPSMRDGTAGWKKIAIEDRKANIPDLAAFRIDFEQWLNGQTSRDRKIIDAMTSGEGTFAIADRFGISAARISQLRRKFEREWQAFQGEAA